MKERNKVYKKERKKERMERKSIGSRSSSSSSLSEPARALEQRVSLLKLLASSLNPQSSVDFVSRSERPWLTSFLSLSLLSGHHQAFLARGRVNCRKTRWKAKSPPYGFFSFSLSLAPFEGQRRSFAGRNSDEDDSPALPLPSQTYLIENRQPLFFSSAFIDPRRVISRSVRAAIYI